MPTAPLKMDPSWADALSSEFETESMKKLREFLKQEKADGKTIYPPFSQTFRSLELVARHDVKVVILGQDPYHGPNQAHGLSFSVRPDVRIPPSLKNIYKELESDLGIPPADHGFLEPWAREGVLLLNDSLSVEAGKAASHRNKGWEQFTDAVINILNEGPPTAFLLWGKAAQAKASTVNQKRHLVVQSSHPSPMGNSCNRGFFGSKPFSKANSFLQEHGRDPVNWKLPNKNNLNTENV